MKTPTMILLALSGFLVVSSMIGYQEIFDLYNRGGPYPGVERFIGVALVLFMSVCLSLMAVVIEISKENK